MQLETKPQVTSAPVFNIRYNSWPRRKYILASFIAVMYLYVLRYDESFLINMRDPKWQHIASFKWILLPHGLAAACALILGPLQFSDHLRQRFAKMHRVLGRFYVGGALIGAPMGVYMHYYELTHLYPGNTAFFSGYIGNIFNALLWDFCTVMAMVFILQGKVQPHRQWMTRSFACALIFLEARFVVGIFHLHGSGDIVLWSCVAMAVPLADLVLYLQENFRTRTSSAKATRATTQIA